ncbi:metallophosphoesterase [Streptacidiphilus rugosus]|uniref:metallophosphoesterase n=1 Tax=Streptacidiphilus rugosus TaxID=405783 RepID=UPI0005692CBF|nr:metallophosphoesterase [Streptacidiphilus rugosus]
MIVIAHLSDIHLDAGGRKAERHSVARTRAVMDYLERLPYDLDAVLVTGDIADHAAPEEYARARRLLTSRHPVLVCPGNHDARAPFREGLLGEAPSGGPVNQALETDRFVVALCDSSVPGEHHGLLEDATLAWLDELLTRTPRTVPVLVGFHHPPVTVQSRFTDSIRQFGEERLAAVAERHPHLLAFVCGHAHAPVATTFAGRPLLVAPGVVSTLRLPWEHGPGRTSAVLADVPPGLLFHVIDEDGRLTTHFRPVAMG